MLMKREKLARLNRAYDYLDSLVHAQKNFYLMNIQFLKELAAELKSNETDAREYLQNLKRTKVEFADKYIESKAAKKRKLCSEYFEGFVSQFRSNILTEILRLSEDGV